MATGAVATAEDPERGLWPAARRMSSSQGEPATSRDHLGTVTDALGIDPEWTDELVWTGQLRADRARRWVGRRAWTWHEAWTSCGSD